MEPPNDPFGGSKHPEWNNHSLTTRSNNEQSELAEEELSTVKKHEKIHVMFVNVGQCWSKLVNVGQWVFRMSYLCTVGENPR
jgi:hypothetical protein